MKNPGVSEHIKPYTSDDVDVAEEGPYQLIVWNDDVNTFDWVIETLVEVCGHSYEQAEQCAFIIHYKGKYAVKQGSYEELEPMCTAITDRSISATIETTVP
jgi:ATP-dependent Clp protease adaptor protein ClpS